jgi:predicted ATPase/DNA-binding CsgD family transcriptional regulator/transcriptional regulator with XRE-family HTH domain
MGPTELRQRREALHLTQAELARAVGVARNTVARWERGELQIRQPGLVAHALDRLEERQSQGGANRPTALAPQSTRKLIAELTSFVGREHELAELRTVLLTTRMLTLTGPGGVGKTRMALRLMSDTFSPDGGQTCFVDLASIATPSLLLPTVAGALLVREQPIEPLFTSLATAIGEHSHLLVLDNCEHLVEACAELADGLLVSCPNLRILATSREALRTAGETIWPLAPLGLPPIGSNATLESVLAAEAVQLFVERARAIAPGFALTPDNSGVVAQICARLDGIPLALELAAARLNILSPSELGARLDDRLQLLVRGPRTAPLRHQTLRATLDWSYDLLDDSERGLFNRLAAFGGEWDLDAMEAACGGDGLEPSTLLDLLTCLVDKSMVTVTGTEPRRYRLLETMRDYARLHLEASGEAERVRARHAHYAVDLVKRLGTVVSASGPDARAALQQLSREWANLRAALQWAVDGAHADIGLRLAGALAEIWSRLGTYQEGSYWLAQVLALPDARTSTFERAWALNGAGWFAILLAQYATAKALTEESLAIGRKLEDALLVSRGLINLGSAALQLGEYDAACEFFSEALSIARTSDDPMGEGMALRNLGYTQLEQCKYASAERYASEWLVHARALQSAWFTASALTLLGQAVMGESKVGQARGLLEEGMRTARAWGDRALIARNLDALGNLALIEGDVRRAAATLCESLQLSYDLGDWPNLPTSLESIAHAHASVGEPGEAVRELGAAAALREALQVPQTPRERTAIARWLPSARLRLTPAAFEKAWTDGHTTALQYVVADAIAFEDRATASVSPTAAGSQPSTRTLTTREREVVVLVARGLTNRQIAGKLVVTEATVAKHIEHILAKLEFSSRVETAAWEASARTGENIRTPDS